MSFNSIEEYLLKGNLLTGSLSMTSNSLRHVYMRKSVMHTKGIADAQGVNIDVAMKLLDDKLLDPKTPNPCFSIQDRGDTSASSLLDAELLQNSNFAAWYNGLRFAVSILRDLIVEPPSQVIQEVITTHGTIDWGRRGHIYSTSFDYEPAKSPDYSQTIKLVTRLKLRAKNDPWKYRTEKRGYGDSLEEAIAATIAAEPLEETR